MRHQQPEKTLNPPGTATPMRPRPFLLLAGVALMTAGASAELDDMVAHWSFDEREGTSAYDSSGNGNDKYYKAK